MAEKPGWEDLFRSAVVRGDGGLLRESIAAGLPLNEACLHEHYAPLHYVAYRGARAGLVAALIEAGADVNVRTPERDREGRISVKGGHTALMFAAAGGRTAIIRLLLAAGADVHVSDGDGSNALGEAAKGGVTRPAGGSKAHTEVIRLLLVAGAKPDAQTLQYAAWGGNPEIVRLVLGAGVGPNDEARLGLPLVWAIVTKGRLGNAEVLVRAGADPDLRATKGQFAGFTARQMASASGKAAVAVLTAAPTPDTQNPATDG
jgi:ankyrin repeat protein